MLRNNKQCGRVWGNEHQRTLRAPAVNMWTTDITLKLTEDFTLYAMFVRPEYHVHIKIEITKVMAWLHWL